MVTTRLHEFAFLARSLIPAPSCPFEVYQPHFAVTVAFDVVCSSGAVVAHCLRVLGGVEFDSVQGFGSIPAPEGSLLLP